MSSLYAFVSEEYYDAWAVVEVESGRQPTQERFIQEFGTPLIAVVDGRPGFVRLSSNAAVRVNFNYYSDLRFRFPKAALCNQDAAVPPIEFKSFFQRLCSMFSKSSAITPITA
jgi:hypothetical protein